MYAQMVETGQQKVRRAEDMSPEERAFQARVDADIARAFPQLGIEILPPGQTPSANAGDFNPHGLQRRLGHDYRIFPIASGGGRKVSIGLPDGTLRAARFRGLGHGSSSLVSIRNVRPAAVSPPRPAGRSWFLGQEPACFAAACRA